jgi:hypothetical protein
MDGADVAARPLRAHDSATHPSGISLLHDECLLGVFSHFRTVREATVLPPFAPDFSALEMEPAPEELGLTRSPRSGNMFYLAGHKAMAPPRACSRATLLADAHAGAL